MKKEIKPNASVNDKKQKQINKKSNKKGKKILKRVLLTILILIIILAGYITYKTYKNGWGLQGFLAALAGHDENTLENLDPLLTLVIGKSGNMTDTIMLCSYNPKSQTGSILSIPRDTFIGNNKNAATAYDKINSVYNAKGIDALIKEVNELLGLEIKYYVVVDTNGLKKLVDTIGGVTFDVPINMKYDDSSQKLYIDLKKGTQLIDGNKAEQLLRFRHNNNGTSYSYEYGDNDYGRMKTQQNFLVAVAKQTLKPGNITKLKEFLDIANENVETNIDLKVAKDYVPYAVNFNVDNMLTDTIKGTPQMCNGVSVIVQDEKDVKEKVNTLFLNNTLAAVEEEKIEETEGEKAENSGVIRIELLNGSKEQDNLSEVTKKLKEAGYNVVKTGTTNTTAKTAIISKTSSTSSEGTKIKDVLGVGVNSSSESKQSDIVIDYTIIIGNDY